MLGTMRFAPHGRGKPAPVNLYGLSVLEAEVDPEGFFGERRLKKAGRALRLGGVGRLLVPWNFQGWELFRRLKNAVEPCEELIEEYLDVCNGTQTLNERFSRNYE